MTKPKKSYKASRLIEQTEYRISGVRKGAEWSGNERPWPEETSKRRKIYNEVNDLAKAPGNSKVKLELRTVFYTDWKEHDQES